MPKIPFIDLNAQYISIKDEIDLAIAEVIAGGSFIGGKFVTDFEEKWAYYCGVDHCISCGNGTDAIEVVLRALEIGLGDEVIVPAVSWISTADAVSVVGAEPVFVDILEGEYTIDPSQISEAITSKTRAIIPVHLYGMPARMSEILKIAKENNLWVVEDCAQAHGAMIGNQKVGSFGVAGTFSFYPTKNLGAYGDAGGIVTNDEVLAEKCRRITNHGQLDKHDHKLLGRNSRMDTMQAAILSVKLKHLDDWVMKRNELAQLYISELKGIESISLPVFRDNFRHAFHLFVIRSKSRRDLIRILSENRIAFGIHYPKPLPLLEAYASKEPHKWSIPVTLELCEEIISLPIYSELSEVDISRICMVLKESQT